MAIKDIKVYVDERISPQLFIDDLVQNLIQQAHHVAPAYDTYLVLALSGPYRDPSTRIPDVGGPAIPPVYLGKDIVGSVYQFTDKETYDVYVENGWIGISHPWLKDWKGYTESLSKQFDTPPVAMVPETYTQRLAKARSEERELTKLLKIGAIEIDEMRQKRMKRILRKLEVGDPVVLEHRVTHVVYNAKLRTDTIELIPLDNPQNVKVVSRDIFETMFY